MIQFNPICTQLSFSGGTGSGALAEMVLRGDIERPKNFVVIRAQPGMENSKTNAYCAQIEQRCELANIPYIEVRRNLLRELLDLKKSGATRFDLPPFWSKNRITAKKGRLLQKCTKAYKIAPMDRALRAWMDENLGISRKSRRIGTNIVCKWIGFSSDEWMRIKEVKQKYVYFEYPLIDRKISRFGIAEYYAKIGVPMPPRSVCNACYANDVAHFKQMHDERPDEFWNEAVAVDEEIRDLRCVGVEDECYVSSTLIPLRQLAAQGFILADPAAEERDQMCHSGHCFV